MSQVIRKYNSGGQTDKPKLLSIKGLGDFNQDDLIKRGYRDVDEYTSSKGLKNAAAADFRNAVQYMLEGMNNGTITMDAMGNFQDATGQKSSTGELDRKKFLGIKTGVKNTENNAYGLAADYLYNIIKGAPQYKQPEVKAEKFNTNDYLTKEISKRWYGGNNIDFGNWFKNRSEKDRNALIADIFNSADYNKLYQEHDWTDTGINSVEDLMARGRAFGSAISNNKLDNDDYNTFATLGGSDLDKFMKAAVEAQPAQAPAVEGQQGRTDRGWSNSEYDRTIDEKGQYHIYKKGTNQEVSGILPGNVFEGVGTKFTKVEDTPSVTRPKISEEQAKKNQAAHQSFTGRSNASLGNDKDITDAGGVIKTSDKVRLGAAMADLASVGLGFVPGANLASTGIGVGSSLAEFGADWASDGLDLGDAGRLAMNLGMDALSLIPVGKTLKATRALGKIRKSIPLIMTAVNAANFLDPTLRAEYSKTLSKLTKGDIKSLNTGDFKNLSAIASTVLMGKNYAQSKKGWWNSSTTPSGKRKVTAMIDGKQQTLEVDDAFFQNTKGKNQVSELKAKFAQQYNKANNLEGDNAIKPESVSIDTKYFGLRPQSEKVEGTKNAGNWVADTKIGNYWLGYRDASQPRGNANIPFSDAWFYKNGIVGGRTRAEKNDIRNRWAESRKRAGEIKNKRDSEIAQKGVEGVSNLVQALNYASKYRTAPLALPAPGQATPSNRVFVMGDGRQRQPLDKTDPSKLSKPGTYQDRAVHTGGTPVESPNANAVRTVRTINSILEPFVPKTTNLPAVIPASRNANKVVASQTIQPSQRLDQFIEGQIPGGRQFGKQRAKTEREYRDVFHPAAEREYNAVWDEAVRNRKDFGYEEVFPKRSPYAPPTEVYVVPEGAMKDPNARYLWELINKKPNTNHTKRADLPHKKSNKKKKTSKDDRVTKKAEGGLIQFLQGGDTVGRIKAKDMSNWNRASALANYDWVADIDRWKASHTGPDDWQSSYMLSFNGGEDIYDQLTNKTGDYFGGKYNYSVQDPLAKQRQITFRGTNQGFDDLIRNGIVGYGTTEGTTGFDVYAGDRTGNRTLARGMTPEDVARFNKQLATRGMELYDKGNGTYRLRALQEPTQHLDEVVVTAPKVAASDTTNPSGIKRVTSTPKKKLKLNVAPEEVLALGRMVGGLAANNRAAKVYKEGLKPTLLDTFENTVPLQGNFQAKTNAEQQAGNLESVAARPRTSDASLQLAGELEASNRAGQARFQGGLQDAEMFYKTRMLGQQESDAAKARRVEVANRNRASMNAIDAAKKQIDAGRITANYQQVIAPYLAGVENRFRQARGMKNQLALESYLNRVGSEYDTELAKIGETYKNDPVGAQREISKLRSKYQSDALKERTSLIDTPWLVRFSGKGSKLSYAEKAMLQRAKDFNKRLSDDNKQFHKDIMESKREHNKMIANMSALTAALIKKGMQL